MAVSYTVAYVDPNGPTRRVRGTFTSAAGDGSGETITVATHGLDRITRADVTLNPGGIGTITPKITFADGSGTVTWTVDDTQGLSGRFYLEGS